MKDSPQQSTPPQHNEPSAWRWAAVVWLGSRLLLLIWGVFIWKTMLVNQSAVNEHYYSVSPITQGLYGALAGVWQRWDTIYYQQITEYGYAQMDWSAFFPFFPLLGQVLHRITGISALASLLIISNLAFYFLLVVLYQLIEKEKSPAVAQAGTLAAVLLPTSFFFYSAYPHSLALLMTLLAYYCARTQKWLLALGCGILAGLSHSTVLPLALMLAWEIGGYIRKARKIQHLSLLLIPLSPFLGTALFLAYRSAAGMPSFSGLMESEWGRIVQWPWQTLADLWLQILNVSFSASLWMDAVLLILALAGLWWGWKRIRTAEWIYLASLIFYLLITTVRGQPLASFGRYILMAFPLYILAGEISQHKSLRLIGFGLGVLLQLLLSGVFFLWGWVD